MALVCLHHLVGQLILGVQADQEAQQIQAVLEILGLQVTQLPQTGQAGLKVPSDPYHLRHLEGQETLYLQLDLEGLCFH